MRPLIEEAPVQVFRHDHFLPPEMAARAFALARALAWHYGWRSAPNAESFHWHVDFDGQLEQRGGANNEDDITDCLTEPLVREIWEHMKSRHFFGHTLIRCYANAHTFGTPGRFHMDRSADGYYSAILYLSERWDSAWGGELTLRDDSGEVFASYLPRPNRLITIPSNVMHAASGLERTCPDLRRCFVFKTRAPY
jgi:SM-20-related protein